MSSELKKIVANHLAKKVSDGQVIGVGTGSTVNAALVAIGERVTNEGLNLSVVPTSFQSAWRCEELGIRVLDPLYSGKLAWGFDGADEVDQNLRLIKGGGAALLQEKILAAKCEEYIIIIDETKVVSCLGEAFAVPVEVVPQASSVVKDAFLKTWCQYSSTTRGIRKGWSCYNRGREYFYLM